MNMAAAPSAQKIKIDYQFDPKFPYQFNTATALPLGHCQTLGFNGTPLTDYLTELADPQDSSNNVQVVGAYKRIFWTKEQPDAVVHWVLMSEGMKSEFMDLIEDPSVDNQISTGFCTWESVSTKENPEGAYEVRFSNDQKVGEFKARIVSHPMLNDLVDVYPIDRSSSPAKVLVGFATEGYDWESNTQQNLLYYSKPGNPRPLPCGGLTNV